MAQPPTRDNFYTSRELKVEDALLYLDQVKMEFSSKEEVYQEFLDIMKNFKTGDVDTPGVIQKVSQLFRGYNKLILGFNTFLPEGHKIKPDDIARSERELQAQEERARHEALENQQASSDGANSAVPAPGSATAVVGVAVPNAAGSAASGIAPKGAGGGAYHVPHQMHPSMMGNNPSALGPSGVAPSAPRSRPAQAGNGMHPQGGVMPPGAAPGYGGGMNQPQHQEFDHAISYVTNIKQRFQNEPDTYKAFLDILHAYQRDQSKPKEQQKGIHEVLDQVSTLFADHPDLLKEFTYFLPDAVQGQAKERLDRAARESEMRKAGMRNRQHGGQRMHVDQYGRPQQVGIHPYGGSGYPRSGPYSGPYDARGAFESGGYPHVGNKRGGGGRGQQGGRLSKKMRDNTLDNLNATNMERLFFERVRKALNDLGRDAWGEFVQSIALYNNGVLEQGDVLTLVGDLLAADDELYDEFKVILSFHSTHDFANPQWAQLPLSELDLSQCRRCTPSYRALPASYPKLICSKRSDLEKNNLNEDWISVPLGGEDGFSFMHMPKNQFEEELFKCEDQRFEIDMVIETNMATMQKLQPMVEEISDMKQGAGGAKNAAAATYNRYRFHLDERSLSTVHLAAIARVYGEHAEDILQLLKKHPVGAIPVIYRRLEQKDHEWRKARQGKIKEWRPIMTDNHLKALDHQRDAFRIKDKKACSMHVLVSEVVDKALALQAANTTPTPVAAAHAATALNAVKEAARPGEGTKAPSEADILSRKQAAVVGCLGVGGVSPCVSAEDVAAAGAEAAAAAGDMLEMADHFSVDLSDKDLQWEAFHILRQALIKSPVSFSDTERIMALWREVFVEFLDLPYEVLAGKPRLSIPAGSDTGSNDKEDNDEEDEETLVPTAEHVLVEGTAVMCPDGLATVSSYEAEGNMYTLTLQTERENGVTTVTWPPLTVWTLSHPAPTDIPPPLEADKPAKKASSSSSSAESAASSSSAMEEDKDGSSAAVSTSTPPTDLSSSGKKRKKKGGEEDYLEGDCAVLPKNSRIMLLTQPGYLFFRLFIIFYEHLKTAREIVLDAHEESLRVEEHPLKAEVREEQLDPEKAALDVMNADTKNGGDAVAVDASAADEDEAMVKGARLVKEGFGGFLQLLNQLMSGSIDANFYDDACRAMVGSKGFRLCTMEKVLGQIIRALQQLVHDKAYPHIFSLYKWEQAHGAAPKRYIANAKRLVEATCADLYRVQIDASASKLAIDYLGPSGLKPVKIMGIPSATAAAAGNIANPSSIGDAASTSMASSSESNEDSETTASGTILDDAGGDGKLASGSDSMEVDESTR